jgi:hypothetical protein
MKRTFLSMAAVLVAITLVFAACQNPADPSTITARGYIEQLDGPEHVTVTSYPGVNFVTWSFVKDARSYTVYRQRADGTDRLVRLYSPPATADQSNATGNPLDYFYIDA